MLRITLWGRLGSAALLCAFVVSRARTPSQPTDTPSAESEQAGKNTVSVRIDPATERVQAKFEDGKSAFDWQTYESGSSSCSSRTGVRRRAARSAFSV